jgi:hypothetical protein
MGLMIVTAALLVAGLTWWRRNRSVRFQHAAPQ